MIHFKRFKQARFISSRKGSDIYKIVQHFGSFFFIHSAKRISRITCRHKGRLAEVGPPAEKSKQIYSFPNQFSLHYPLPTAGCTRPAG